MYYFFAEYESGIFIDEKEVVKDVCDIKYYKETIIVLPENTDEKYIRAVYLH
jgi:hypothetical protein